MGSGYLCGMRSLIYENKNKRKKNSATKNKITAKIKKIMRKSIDTTHVMGGVGGIWGNKKNRNLNKGCRNVGKTINKIYSKFIELQRLIHKLIPLSSNRLEKILKKTRSHRRV